MIGLLLALSGAAHADPAATVAATGSVVGAEEVGVRPGLRIGFEPGPQGGLEAVFDAALPRPDADPAFDAGLALVGRLWLSPDDGEGIFLLGRTVAGVAGRDGVVGPWTGLSVGFGGRPVPALQLEASAGPEWALADGPRWRTELSVGVVLGKHTVGGGDSVRHGKIRKVPTE